MRFDDLAVSHLIDAWYNGPHELRGCHPRDLVEAISDAAVFDEGAPVLTVRALDEACNTYFLRGGA